MALPPGTHLGPYEITGALGAGGMGEVYRASDSRLGRQVAIKVLPQGFASNVERMARFGREAQVLAALNHSSIAHVYGLEENDGTRALVMELVEGPTLAEQIAQGRLPVDDALRIAKQIAEALEYAHERGIIHRDLKPANVKVTLEGNVKILDFGLAKALDDSPASMNINTSPTLSMAATQAGLILGTAAYMSPEQARGRAVDRRTDIWAFGAVLYEMLSRKQPFEGEDTSQIMAAVIMKDPDWSQLPPDVPKSIRHLVERCLTKDPAQRLQAIGEARIAIDRVLSGAKEEPVTRATANVPAWRWWLPWALAGMLLVAFVVAVLFWVLWRPVQPTDAPIRLNAELGADIRVGGGPGNFIALSPDSKMIAFTARVLPSPPNQLYLRRLDQIEATAVAGTEGARDPFFSPDGQWVAFFTDAHLMKVSVAGGAPVMLCDAASPRGGSWGDDGDIVFNAVSSGALFRVSAAGGTPVELTKLDEGELSHRWPEMLPGGKTLLFTAQVGGTTFENAEIVALSIKTGKRKILLRDAMDARYLAGSSEHNGYLLYAHQNTIFAVPFDVDRLETSGNPVPIVSGVGGNNATGIAWFAVSPAGTFVYVLGGDVGLRVQVAWVDSQGKTELMLKEAAGYGSIRLSPNGKSLALDIANKGVHDIWIYKQPLDVMSRLTFGSAASPTWTSDGQRIAFGSLRDLKTPENLYWQRADGTGDVQRLTESKFPQTPWSWHPSGKFLAFVEEHPETGEDIMILPMEGSESAGWKPGQPYAFLNTSAAETEPVFSPDGRWLAYSSNESGRYEVYVRPFPGPGGKWQISNDSGRLPTWALSAKELFYQQSVDKVMTVHYAATGNVFQAGNPQPWASPNILFRPPFRGFDVSPDGNRVVALRVEPENSSIKRSKAIFVFNFADELRRALSSASK